MTEKDQKVLEGFQALLSFLSNSILWGTVTATAATSIARDVHSLLIAQGWDTIDAGEKAAIQYFRFVGRKEA